ncbi:MAG: 3-carboxy-cis,cis-muconate cycloisomerase [Candidimonas sp.]|nr:MAG: 3-carboxy-cis,cis-muconate cycloisomerase [Candidimonas sp.]TAM20981.1 MAG: 3-carboxy-cis,cis-muconate cycloisomerase [Candidimonas sp.]
MSVLIFDSFLTTPEMIKVFDDTSVIQAMLQFEKSLARAQAEEGIIPQTAACEIARHCDAALYDIPDIVLASRSAGSMAIPLVKALTKAVATSDKYAATHVHWGSTSQDAIDSAMVLVTRDALTLIDSELASLIQRLLELGEQHLQTPVLARTLMQPAQVTSLGFKLAGWAAPLVRSRAQLKELSGRALQLQLGGAVGTLSVMGRKGPLVAQRMGANLHLKVPDASWHTQRDEWVRLGLEVAVLVGSLGKIATDLSLMAQGEIAELAEPSGQGRGGSTAMPHKRNPVSSMIALAAAGRVPQRAAALLTNMPQQHERGLGNWQAELAEWPGLFLSAHGAVHALGEAMDGLHIDSARMLRNIDALQGLVFAEAVSIYLAGSIERPQAHQLMEQLTRQAVANQQPLSDIVIHAVEANADLRKKIDLPALKALFDPAVANASAAVLADAQLKALRAKLSAL